MERDPSQTLFTVALTGIRDRTSQMKLAQTLSSVSGRLPMETVMKRLDSLPWTLTRKASYKRAYRLTKLLQSLGGEVRCVPPLPKTTKPVMDETQILPGAELLGQTHVMSATELVLPGEELPAHTSPPAIVPSQDVGKQEALHPPKPSPEEGTGEQALQGEEASAAAAGFLKKHLWTILAGILAFAVTTVGMGLGLYILTRFLR